MQQLKLFDEPVTQEKIKTGFNNRWHLIDKGEVVGAAVPGNDYIIIMGIYKSMLSRLNIKIGYNDYRRFIEVAKLLEVGP